MSTVIIIDGPRCSGKSTMINALSATLDEYSIKHTVRKDKKCDNYAKETLDFIISIEDDDIVICDRLYLSEFVMSSYYQRKSMSDLYVLTDILEKQLVEAVDNVLYVVMEVSEENINKRLDDRPASRGLDFPTRLVVRCWRAAVGFSNIAVTVENNNAEQFWATHSGVIDYLLKTDDCVRAMEDSFNTYHKN